MIDLPRLLQIKDETRANELLQYVDVIALPHITDKNTREKILNQITGALPKPPKQKQNSAEDQYQAQLARMRGGG